MKNEFEKKNTAPTLAEIAAQIEENDEFDEITLIFRHNYRVILAAQVLPKFVEILKKYDGRKAGEKTRQKISEEMRAACGCSVYFDKSYIHNSNFAAIYEDNEGGRRGENFIIYGGYGLSLVDEENRINGKLAADDLLTDTGDYIENPAARVEEIAEAERRIAEARKTYNETIDAYNALLVDGYDRKSHVY